MYSFKSVTFYTQNWREYSDKLWLSDNIEVLEIIVVMCLISLATSEGIGVKI